MGGLPEEFAIGFAKRHKIPAVTGQFGVAQCFIIRTDKDLATNDEGARVTLRTEFCCPFDVFAGFHIPTRGNIFFVRDHVTA